MEELWIEEMMYSGCVEEHKTGWLLDVSFERRKGRYVKPLSCGRKAEGM